MDAVANEVEERQGWTQRATQKTQEVLKHTTAAQKKKERNWSGNSRKISKSGDSGKGTPKTEM